MSQTLAAPHINKPVARCQNLVVKYGQFTALNGISVDIPAGCVGLLGPNGAGKSTLLKTLLGFIKPTTGNAEVMDIPVVGDTRPIRQVVGLMPEQDCHIPGICAVEFVAYAGELAGMPSNQAMRRAHEVLEYCGLGEARYRLVETYSTGMKQRIKLAQALVHGPKLLLLDEPTNGLDPRGRNDMLDLIRSISQSGLVNVIVSSHLLKDIERTCDYAVVVFQGQLRAFGLIRDLISIEGRPFNLELKEPSTAFLEASHQHGLEILSSSGYQIQLRGSGPPEEVVARVWQAAKASGAEVRIMEPATRSLEEAFLEAIR